jgi:hypothetical protein
MQTFFIWGIFSQCLRNAGALCFSRFQLFAQEKEKHQILKMKLHSCFHLIDFEFGIEYRKGRQLGAM